MIKPAISPRTITGSATAGIISAARSGVRNIKDITETISNEPEVTKEEKFGINYVGFFGSNRVNKDLKKSMKTIKDSVGSTFGIAKALKESVTKGAGVFGFVGKLIGGAASALPIFTLLGLPILKAILGIVAVGGITALLTTFGGQIIKFVRDKASGFKDFIKEVVGEFFISRRTSAQFQDLKEVSDARIQTAIEESNNKDKQQAVVEANQNEIAFLEEERKNYVANTSKNDDLNYDATLKAYDDRIKQLKTGRLDLVRKNGNFFQNMFPDLLGKFATDVTQTQPNLPRRGYIGQDPEEKLKSIRNVLRSFGTKDELNKAKLLYQQQLKRGEIFGTELSPEQKLQVNDMLRFLEQFGDDPLGELDEDKKQKFLKELSGITANPKELSKKIPENVSSVSGVTQSGNAGNVAVLPMGKNSNESLVRNDTGGLLSGPTMKLHPNFDIDNFVAPINMANFNVV